MPGLNPGWQPCVNPQVASFERLCSVQLPGLDLPRTAHRGGGRSGASSSRSGGRSGGTAGSDSSGGQGGSAGQGAAGAAPPAEGANGTEPSGGSRLDQLDCVSLLAYPALLLGACGMPEPFARRRSPSWAAPADEEALLAAGVRFVLLPHASAARRSSGSSSRAMVLASRRRSAATTRALLRTCGGGVGAGLRLRLVSEDGAAAPGADADGGPGEDGADDGESRGEGLGEGPLSPGEVTAPPPPTGEGSQPVGASGGGGALAPGEAGKEPAQNPVPPVGASGSGAGRTMAAALRMLAEEEEEVVDVDAVMRPLFIADLDLGRRGKGGLGGALASWR